MSDKPQARWRELAGRKYGVSGLRIRRDALLEAADLVDKLEAAAKETHDKTKLTAFIALAERYEAKVAKLEAERDRYREALQWYGIECPNCGSPGRYGTHRFEVDGFVIKDAVFKTCVQQCGATWLPPALESQLDLKLANIKMEKAEQRIVKLRAALQWYANASYERTVSDKLGYFDPAEWLYGEPEILEDNGERARKALEQE